MISDAYDDFQSESLKVSEMVEAVMISDYRADVETSLSLAKVLMLMLNITDADAEETDKADAECKYLLTGTNIFSAKKINSVQDEVFHIMDSIMRDREDCYVVRNSAVGSPSRASNFTKRNQILILNKNAVFLFVHNSLLHPTVQNTRY